MHRGVAVHMQDSVPCAYARWEDEQRFHLLNLRVKMPEITSKTGGEVTGSISIGQASLRTRPHALYRFYDRSDVLLYVGITVDPSARFKKHAGDKLWWGEVDHIDIEQCATRREAEDAEREAIKKEEPLYNKVHNLFVPAPHLGVTDATLACDIVYGHVGIDYGSDEHARLVVKAKSNAIEDERPFGDVEAEVANLLVSDLLSERWSTDASDQVMQRCAELMVKALPEPARVELLERVRHDSFCAGDPEPTDEEALPHMVRHAGRFIAELLGEGTDGAA